MSSKEPDARIRIDKMLLEAGWKLPGWAKDEEINVTTEINNNSGEADYVLLSSKENHLCTVEAKKKLLSPLVGNCLLYTSPSPRDDGVSRMPSSA